MDNQFGLYPQFYVKRKDLLFPLIEKYSGQSTKGKTHGQVIQLYYGLLKSNDAFINEVDGLIAGAGFKNAIGDWKIWNIFKKKDTDPGALVGTGYDASDFDSGGGVSVGGGISGFLGNLLGLATAIIDKKATEEEQFNDIILNEQKNNDTTKILIVSGITIVILGLGVYFVVKMKK